MPRKCIPRKVCEFSNYNWNRQVKSLNQSILLQKCIWNYHLKYCNFKRCCWNEIRYILKHYVPKLLPFSLFLVCCNLCYSLWHRESTLSAFFIKYYFFFSKPYGMCYMRTWEKLKFESVFLIKFYIDDFWLICLLIPNEYKFGFLLTLS